MRNAQYTIHNIQYTIYNEGKFLSANADKKTMNL